MLCCWRHSVTRLMRSWWRTLVILLTPLIFLPLALPLDWNVNVRPMCSLDKLIPPLDPLTPLYPPLFTPLTSLYPPLLTLTPPPPPRRPELATL